ncbi:hypothetical protein B8W69_14470 [Mycobacterium vulneris]|uniref:Uncharacterized protein n=1 Tax=Mycolicibacterium vulneris TaxID=547163 RepID=A0A1X2L037_9MYCO|nr:hypothetical protein B8W69_14470 [Mycolicibacterium vulneris]
MMMILGGADALTNHCCGADDLGVLGPAKDRVRVWMRHVQGTRHPYPAPPHGWRIRNDWRMITA